MKSFLVLFALALAAQATVYFEEDFNEGWEDRWVISTNKGEQAGSFGVTAGDFYGNAELDKGLKTLDDARFYQISAGFPSFSNKDKSLVIQYSAKHEQNIDCGGGYVKLLPAGLDQTNFNGDSEYNIMFGPDICGSQRKTHAIITYEGTNHLVRDFIQTRSDELSHLYTFVINPDQTYAVKIDGQIVKEGNLVDDWDFLEPKEIDDPEESKPLDWVDVRYIDDPEDTKPEGWDEIEPMVEDPDAEQPEDWDEELDGEWEAPLIDNPEYQGEWRPKRIENPEYIGEWEHPQIPNPAYVYDDSIYAFDSHAFLGIEIWQVKAGTIFDNILVTDSEEEAEIRSFAILERFTAEKAARDAHAQAEREAAEAAAAAAAAAEDEEDDDDDDDDENKDEL